MVDWARAWDDITITVVIIGDYLPGFLSHTAAALPGCSTHLVFSVVVGAESQLDDAVIRLTKLRHQRRVGLVVTVAVTIVRVVRALNVPSVSARPAQVVSLYRFAL